MKIYIAGRITGNPHYKAPFKATAAMLQKNGHTVLNPAELPEGMKPAGYMRICFAMLDSADVVLFQLGWQVSKGAKLECDCELDPGDTIQLGDSVMFELSLYEDRLCAVKVKKMATKAIPSPDFSRRVMKHSKEDLPSIDALAL